jgi:hypothetical protein
MIANVPISDTGIARLGMRAARALQWALATCQRLLATAMEAQQAR